MTWSRSLGYFWIVILAMGISFFFTISFQRSAQVPDYPGGCDAFGYLMMAKTFRKSGGLNLRSLRRFYPDFSFEDERTRELVGLMRSSQLPLEDWDELVAPHAHHYFPLSGKVGPQYPPGTGWILSFFPEGSAVRGLNQASCVVALILTLGGLFFCGLHRLWGSAGLVALLGYWCLEVFLKNANFSVTAVIFPLGISVFLLMVLAHRQEHRPFQAQRYQPVLLFLSGCLFGFSVLIRISVLILYPALAFLVCFWTLPKTDKFWPSIKSAIFNPFHYGLGLFLGFLGVYQNQITGSWHLPTYGPVDVTFPSFVYLRSNFDFYLGQGRGAGDNWLIFNLLIGGIGMLGLSLKMQKSSQLKGIGLKGLKAVAIGILTWVFPLLYFMTHQVQVGYYMVSSVWLTALVFAWRVARLESALILSKTHHPMSWLRLMAGALTLVPGGVALEHIAEMRHLSGVESQEVEPSVTLPKELRNPKVWLWADSLSGTVRYFEDRPAFKLIFSKPETRRWVYQSLFRRGEPQYLINDSIGMTTLMEEARDWGGHLVQVGEVAKRPAYRIDWPAGF